MATRIQNYLAGDPATIEAFQEEISHARLLETENGWRTTAPSETVSPAWAWFQDFRADLVKEETLWQSDADSARAFDLRAQLEQNRKQQLAHDQARPMLYHALGPFAFWAAEQGIGPASWRAHYQGDKKLHTQFLDIANAISDADGVGGITARRAQQRVEEFYNATGLVDLEESVKTRFGWVEAGNEYAGRPLDAAESRQVLEDFVTGPEEKMERTTNLGGRSAPGMTESDIAAMVSETNRDVWGRLGGAPEQEYVDVFSREIEKEAAGLPEETRRLVFDQARHLGYLSAQEREQAAVQPTWADKDGQHYTSWSLRVTDIFDFQEHKRPLELVLNEYYTREEWNRDNTMGERFASVCPVSSVREALAILEDRGLNELPGWPEAQSLARHLAATGPSTITGTVTRLHFDRDNEPGAPYFTMSLPLPDGEKITMRVSLQDVAQMGSLRPGQALVVTGYFEPRPGCGMVLNAETCHEIGHSRAAVLAQVHSDARREFEDTMGWASRMPDGTDNPDYEHWLAKHHPEVAGLPDRTRDYQKARVASSLER